MRRLDSRDVHGIVKAGQGALDYFEENNFDRSELSVDAEADGIDERANAEADGIDERANAEADGIDERARKQPPPPW